MAGDDHDWQGLLLVAHLKLSDRRSIEVKRRREPEFQKFSFSVEKPSNVQRLPNGMFGIKWIAFYSIQALLRFQTLSLLYMGALVRLWTF